MSTFAIFYIVGVIVGSVIYSICAIAEILQRKLYTGDLMRKGLGLTPNTIFRTTNLNRVGSVIVWILYMAICPIAFIFMIVSYMFKKG